METTTISPLEKAVRELSDVEVSLGGKVKLGKFLSRPELGSLARAVLQAIRPADGEGAFRESAVRLWIDAALAEQPPRRIPER